MELIALMSIIMCASAKPEVTTATTDLPIPILVICGSIVISITTSAITLYVNTRLKTKQLRVENITKQRINDIIEIRRMSAEICMLTDAILVRQKKDDAVFLERLILESKKMDFLFKRTYEQDRQVIGIKNSLIDCVQNYCNNQCDINEIQKYNKLFGEIMELFTYISWQLIKKQVEDGKVNSTSEFRSLFLEKEIRANYLSQEDEICISNILTKTSQHVEA